MIITSLYENGNTFFHIKVEDMGDVWLIVIFRQNIYLL